MLTIKVDLMASHSILLPILLFQFSMEKIMYIIVESGESLRKNNALKIFPLQAITVPKNNNKSLFLVAAAIWLSTISTLKVHGRISVSLSGKF